jgi:putative membrane protein
MIQDKKLHLFLLLSLVPAFALSRYGAKGGLDWWIQVSPIVVALPVLLITYVWFRFTPMAYILIWIYAIVLLIGAHYNYADPFFTWLKEALHLKRNDFDRLCHFLQGFVPAIIARELLLRRTRLLPGKKLFFIVVSICTAASALFEILEWWGAVLTGRSSSSFLGTQGDVWDTQEDMLTCFIGSIVSLLLLARMHNRQLARLGVDKVKK